MTRVPVFCCLIAVVFAASTCHYNGKVYKEKQGFLDLCNYCICRRSGVVSCTRYGICIDSGWVSPFKVDKNQHTCKLNGRTYKVGETFDYNCSRCTCVRPKAIVCHLVTCKNQYEGNKDVCEFRGKSYRVGESFNNGCIRCTCMMKSRAKCTLEQCRLEYFVSDGAYRIMQYLQMPMR